MATKKIYDLAVAVDKYTDRDGKEKNRYQNVGCILQKDDGSKFIMLERWFNPAGVPNPDGRSTVLLSMFEPRQAVNGQQQSTTPSAPQQAQAGGVDFDEDIPFNRIDARFV